MLDYAVKLTRDPGGMDAGDVDRLRDAGFDDPAILDICQVASYYNYVNRLADGLGVELEDDRDDTSHPPASGPSSGAGKPRGNP